MLAYKNYNYADVLFNEVEYPQDIRNCNKCHDATNAATPDAKNWMNVRAGWPAARVTMESTSRPARA